jgi:hypothetical protein
MEPNVSPRHQSHDETLCPSHKAEGDLVNSQLGRSTCYFQVYPSHIADFVVSDVTTDWFDLPELALWSEGDGEDVSTMIVEAVDR